MDTDSSPLNLSELHREIKNWMGILEEDTAPRDGSRHPNSKVAMWHRFKNLVFSLKTYDALSPDLKVRRQVNRLLCQRAALDLEQWFQLFYQSQGITYAVAAFAYVHLPRYSGLKFERVLPTDRLDQDLCWTQVCWFDWEVRLYDDFWQQFGVDISECLDVSALLTVKDLMACLTQYDLTQYEGKKPQV